MAYTAEEIQKMRAAIAEHDMAAAGEEAASRIEFMKPVRSFVEGDTFTKFQSELSDLQPQYAADDSLNVHINAILMILGNLAKAAEHHIPAPISAQVTPVEPVAEPVEEKAKK